MKAAKKKMGSGARTIEDWLQLSQDYDSKVVQPGKKRVSNNTVFVRFAFTFTAAKCIRVCVWVCVWGDYDEFSVEVLSVPLQSFFPS